jgi:serine/threonine-protein kinase
VGLILLAALWILRPDRQSADRAASAASGTADTADTESPSDSKPISARKMIVVIPFENVGSAEDAYFATGMTEEITSRLASVSGLGVISRNSAAQYAGGNTPISQIGKELDVEYVLQGTVRWAGGDDSTRVRITPQLISVADDTQVWSDTYDRVVDDIFEVQSDIASQVIGQLDVALLGSEQQAITARPTDNLEAYKVYLRGWEYWTHPDLSQKNFQVAAQMFQRAVELDPAFAVAHAYLSLAHSRIFWFGGDASPKRMVQARAAADRALQLEPNLGEGHMALGYFHYYGSRDYETALEEFQQAEQLLPGNAEAIGAIGFIRRRQGNLESAMASFKRALELDPRAADMADNVADAAQRLREHEEADRYYDQSLSILPDQITAHAGKAMNLWAWKGDTESARALMERMPEHQSTGAIVAWTQFEVANREFESTLARLEAAPFEFFDTSTIAVLPKALNMGRVLRFMGRDEEAKAEFLEALPHMERYARELPEDPFSHVGLARVLSGLDRHDEAIAEIETAMELLPIERDALYGAQIIEWRAQVYANAGRPDEALDSIEQLLSIPYFFTRLHPNWDSLRDHPRYTEILQKYQ